MEATPDPTARLVVAVCLVVAGIAGVAVVDDAVGVVSAQSGEVTDVRIISIEPNPSNPGDEIEVTAELLNGTIAVADTEATFYIDDSKATRTSNNSGIVTYNYTTDADNVNSDINV